MIYYFSCPTLTSNDPIAISAETEKEAWELVRKMAPDEHIVLDIIYSPAEDLP